MFQFTASSLHNLWIQLWIPELFSGRFPHSDISGSMVICTSPKLFAACHVLRRLLMPRHSPCALFSLTFVDASSVSLLRPVSLRYPFRVRSLRCVSSSSANACAGLPSDLAVDVSGLFFAKPFGSASLETRCQYPIPWILTSNLMFGSWWR